KAFTSTSPRSFLITERRSCGSILSTKLSRPSPICFIVSSTCLSPTRAAGGSAPLRPGRRPPASTGGSAAMDGVLTALPPLMAGPLVREGGAGRSPSGRASPGDDDGRPMGSGDGAGPGTALLAPLALLAAQEPIDVRGCADQPRAAGPLLLEGEDPVGARPRQ